MSRLVVVDFINKLFESINVVIDGHLVILFEQCKVICGSYELKVGGTAILVMESSPYCWGIVLDIDQFEQFCVWQAANNGFSGTFMIVSPFGDSCTKCRWNDASCAVWVARCWIWFCAINDPKELVELEGCFSSNFPNFEFVRLEIAKSDLLAGCSCLFCH